MIHLVDGSSKTVPSPHYQSAMIDDVVRYCQTKQILGVDTETEGFDFTTKKMIMFQIGDENQQFVIDTRRVSIEPLRNILQNKNILKIFHNAKFDYKFIKKWSNIICEGIYDTYLNMTFCQINPNDVMLIHDFSYSLMISLNTPFCTKMYQNERSPFHCSE